MLLVYRLLQVDVTLQEIHLQQAKVRCMAFADQVLPLLQDLGGGGQHSSDVAFALPTQPSQETNVTA